MADDLTGAEFIKLSPSSLVTFVDQNATLYLCDGREMSGFIYTVDPVSSCIVMKQNDDDNITFIMGHSVKRIARNAQTDHKENHDFIEKFINKDSKVYGKDELRDKKERLKEWLTKNRIPVQEKGDCLQVMDVLWIDPPYDSESCRCTNEIVLSRVRTLIENKPS